MAGHGRKKRKVGYIDRAVIIENQTKRQEVVEGARPLPVSSKINTYERFFTHKLAKCEGGEDGYCEAYVMQNEICVVVSPEISGSLVVDGITFANAAILGSDKISGKRKKGAWKCAAGALLCTLRLADGSTRELRTPIGGQVLEVNTNVQADPTLLQRSRIGDGFLAVIYPSTKLPKL